MKKVFNIIAILLLSLILATPVNALNSAIYFEGGAENFVYYPGSDWSETDMFDGLKNAMPGDTATEEIKVRNTAPEYDYVKIYLRAEPHDPIANPLLDETAATETVSTMRDFLAQLSIKVYNGTELINDSSADQLSGLADNILLGQFANGEGTTLKIELAIPVTLGNGYTHRAGEIDWIFTAEGYVDDEIVEPPVNPDGPKPLPDDVPRTLDMIMMYVAEFLACMILLILSIATIRSAFKKESEK